MEQYTGWIDDQIIAIFENADHSVDQEEVQECRSTKKPKNGNGLDGHIAVSINNSRYKEGSLYKGLILMVPPARIELAAHGLGIC